MIYAYCTLWKVILLNTCLYTQKDTDICLRDNTAKIFLYEHIISVTKTLKMFMVVKIISYDSSERWVLSLKDILGTRAIVRWADIGSISIPFGTLSTNKSDF